MVLTNNGNGDTLTVNSNGPFTLPMNVVDGQSYNVLVSPPTADLGKLLALPRNLAAAGIPEDALEPMANAVMQITRLLKNNPREMTLPDARAIYREAFQGGA